MANTAGMHRLTVKHAIVSMVVRCSPRAVSLDVNL